MHLIFEGIIIIITIIMLSYIKSTSYIKSLGTKLWARYNIKHFSCISSFTFQTLQLDSYYPHLQSRKMGVQRAK